MSYRGLCVTLHAWEKRHPFRYYNSFGRGKGTLRAYQSGEVLEAKATACMDMTDNSQKQPTMWRGSRAHIFGNNDINITTGPGAGSSHLLFYRRGDGRRQSQQNDDIWVMDTFGWLLFYYYL